MKPVNTKEDLELRFGRASSVMKLVTGVGNNAAWMVVLDAYDQVKKHRNWKHQLKGGHTVKGYYKQAISTFHSYEKQLIYTNTNRFFHVADMPEQTRRTYAANLTDRQYYDMWASIGGAAYQKTRPLITSLWNKYRLSLIQHDIEQPDIMAWAMTATAALEMACTLYDMAIDDIVEGYELPRKLCQRVFKDFNLRTVTKLWEDAMNATDPKTDTYELTDLENRNIEHGLKQLGDAWLSLHTLYQSTAETLADYDEVFRTKGFQKKALRSIADLEAETYKALEDEQ